VANKTEDAQQDLVVEEPKVHCLGKLVPIEKVVPNPLNPNVHPDEQLKILAEVLKVNGWRSPIIVSVRSGMVVKGHGRLQTAKFLKLKKVPVEFQEYADEQAEFMDMVADNRVAQHSYVDALKLGDVIKRISEKGQKSLGYSTEELGLIMSAEYVAPKATDRTFVVLETLKLTKEAKAIIGGAVQKFCLRIGKEVDWGEALSQICMAWTVMVLPTMPQSVAPPPVPAPAPEPEAAPASKPKKAKKAAKPEAAAAPAPETTGGAADGSQVEKSFVVKYVAGTTLGKEEVMVVRPEGSAERYYTTDPAVAKAATELKGKKATALLASRGGALWVESLEEAA
jgi:hypothetical protein